MFRQAARLRPLIHQPHKLCNGKGRPDLVIAQLSSRSISTTKVQPRSQLLKRPAILCSTPSLHVLPRFASTSSAVNSSSATPDASSFIPDATGANAWDPNFQDVVSNNHVNEITPHIGYLKELGVDFGWGPTSVVQWLMEHIHIYTGLPWYGTLMVTALSLRLLILPLVIRGADNSGKLSAIQPLIQPLQQRSKAAKLAGNQTEMIRSMKELNMIRSRAGVSMMSIFAPLLIQVPLAFGAFRLTREMIALNVPGLETGGILWFTDLTFSGPFPYYGILPLMTSVTTHLSLRRGGELGSSTPEQQRMMNVMKWVFPFLSFGFTMWMPPAITLQFFTASAFALLQTYVLSSNRMRGILGIHPLVKHTVASTGPYSGTLTRPVVDATLNKKNAFSISDKYSDLKERAKKWQQSQLTKDGNRLTKNEIARAAAYEKRRRQELEDELNFRRQQLLNKQSATKDKDR